MKKTEVTDTPIKYCCEFCKSEFIRERTLLTHICEKKQRWMNRDLKGVRIGFQAWLQFYAKSSMSKTKNKTHEEFIKSPYYTAFVKFGNYCGDVNVLNPSRYIDWLLRDNIKLDNWTSDSVYTKFVYEYVRTEDPYDAVHRTVQYCIELCKSENILPHDCLRYINTNRICYAITTGKISPWLLYQSVSGLQFLKSLNADQEKLIMDYINPEQWALKFKREPELAKNIKELLRDAGY